MRKTFEVIDNFYRKPMDYREQALKRVSLPQCTGKSSIYGEPGPSDSLDDESFGHIFRILGWDSNSVLQARICGYFTFRGENIRDPWAMQLDGFSWAGFVCLSLTERCAGGIWFYRRERFPPSGSTEAVPGDLDHSMISKLPGVDELQSLKQEEAGQVTLYLPMRFNRLVLFQTSELGNVVNPGFEKTFESELLIQVIAFREEPVCK